VIRDPDGLVAALRGVHEEIREDVVAACERSAPEQMARVVADGPGDTVFEIDRVSEAALVERFEGVARERPLVLIHEGQEEAGGVVLPRGTDPDEAELRVIVDPVDGSRGLMYGKRSAWILTGVAPNRGPETTLADIELAVMTEIPTPKQHLCDCLWTVAGEGASGERLNRFTGERSPLTPRPSSAGTISQGFGGVARFMPGARAELAAIDDRVHELVLGPVRRGKAQAFEDQYISTGGQLYELMVGHDRWLADLRPLVEPVLKERGLELGLCCHPYDLCTELIAREAGVIVCDEQGRRLCAPLDTTSDVSWVGYANGEVRDQVQPALLGALRERGLLVEH
jgi:fructose-1,6-bisphosphatase/inositol monophosphatase family enzyme